MNAQSNNAVKVIRINGSARYAVCFPRKLYEGECKLALSELRRISGELPFQYGYAGRDTLVLDCYQEGISPLKTDEKVNRFVGSMLISLHDCHRDGDDIEVVADHPQARAVNVCPIQGVRRF